MQNTSKVLINEIFDSIQGEGLDVGRKHLFIRFTKCNLNCKYCDTDFKKGKYYSSYELYNIIQSSNSDTVSFTGGEPLLEADFLYDFFKNYKLNKRIYLETNGTLYSKLDKIIDYIDVVALDIKLKSASFEENKFIDNDKFLKIASKKEAFIKVVFNSEITSDEIKNVVLLAEKYSVPIVLQPVMPLDKNLNLTKIFNDFYKDYSNIRLIPQTHKFLNLI